MISIESVLEKVGAGGVVIATLGCTACFPALGALAAALGLGFLSPFEGALINALLPLFALCVLVVNGYGWYKNRVHWRGLLSVIGPLVILATLYPLWQYGWSVYVFYGALMLVLTVSIADLFWAVPSHANKDLR